MGIVSQLIEKEIKIELDVLRRQGFNIDVEKKNDRYKIVLNSEISLHATSFNCLKFLKFLRQLKNI